MTTRQPEDRLGVISTAARLVGAEPIATEAIELRDRLWGGRFYVACIGQFKRGKSTLLNALVGQAVLPVGVVPVTAVVTEVKLAGTCAKSAHTCASLGRSKVKLGGVATTSRRR